MAEALTHKGFSFIEVIAPCSTLYGRKNRLGTGYDIMKFYHDNCDVKHGADTADLDIGFQTRITVGKFVDVEKPTFLDRMHEGLDRK